ncbi:nucleolin 1-like [Chenopodium quinoa]|uniref:nucleolin 1-like n=1 Tax=Chenopodium quinoa TaxID=63459 RepID=UPI000B774680|nr:nucleolin 1-like [Chenopodium quinoa]
MEGVNRDGERTFRVAFSEEGAVKLAERLADTLKDYMGDDVDDTLVKYVIVLLGNGRRKEEVKEDLDVFLGDKSDSFVTWLWDHLATYLDQYVGSHQSCSDEVAKAKPELVEQPSKDDSSHPVSESDRGKSSKTSRSRHNRDWKSLVTDKLQPPLIRSSVTKNKQNEEKTYPNALHTRQSVSPQRTVHRKRNRPDEHPRPKRATIAAPRRLLQFAVREAVATTRSSNSVSEPARKRLRSVVSTPIGNLTEEVNHKRPQSVTRLQSSMATAIKAVEDASNDVKRVRTGNVFDRLSRGDRSSDQVSFFKEPAVQDDEYDDFDIRNNSRQRYLQTRDNIKQHIVNASMMDSSTGLASDSASDNEGYDDVNVVGAREFDVSETGTSAKRDDSLRVHYSVAQNTEGMTRQSQRKDQELPASAANTKHKIVNISVNVNTWKPPHYQAAREKPGVETLKSTQEIDTGAGNSNVRLMKENSNSVTVYGNGSPAADTQKENQNIVGSTAPGPYSTGLPLEDADSRTIYVNNVHFAATKDTLSRHFNKFGEVLKVIILTDAATGHPKGSAYVEFMRKEAADNALALDGTSFMSRIIKVMKKSSVQQEANPVMTWPRITRGSPFPVPRFAQSPFPRVFPGAYRARPPVKPGMRSMQWKRDSQQTSVESVASVPGNITAGRGLTYIRTEAKSDGNPGGL